MERPKIISVASGGDETDDTKSMKSMSSRLSLVSKFKRATLKIKIITNKRFSLKLKYKSSRRDTVGG